MSVMDTSSLVELAVDGELFRRFPALRVGGFAVRGVDRATGSLTSRRAGLVERAIRELAAAGVTAEDIATEPRIAGWRQACKAMGLKPSAYRSSAEQLGRRLLRDPTALDGVPSVVAAYGAVSARHLAPLGGYDVERLPSAAIALRPARAGDRFAPLGTTESFPLDDRVAVYACGDDVICWAFNHRDSRRTALDASTSLAVFLGEAVHEVQHAALDDALHELRGVFVEAGAECGPVRRVDREHATAPLTIE